METSSFQKFCGFRTSDDGQNLILQHYFVFNYIKSKNPWKIIRSVNKTADTKDIS
jgi:hypothetical protein